MDSLLLTILEIIDLVLIKAWNANTW
jgi:hypothetical protein